jgi:outer membrane biosynthesis protein TonB
LPLDSISARVVVPRDIRPEEFVVVETSHLPFQPTELDARVAVPQGAAPPEVIPSSESLPADLVDPDIFLTGEINLLTKTDTEERTRGELARNASSIVLHLLLIALIIVEPKIFPPRQRSQAELDLARRQMTILLPPGAFEEPKVTPHVKPPEIHVDPHILRRVAPPEPEPQPAPKQPEVAPKELPSAPVPQPNAIQPPPQPATSPAKPETSKPQPRLETPEEQPKAHGLILPKSSPSRSIQDSIRDSAKMNAPTAITDGGQIPGTRGIPGAGGQGTAYGAVEMLTPTQGVDFSDYLHRVYITVKQNWFAVMPESVQLGDKGVVSLRFRIMKEGSVPTGEPVRVRTSGKEPLDRAAISSVRASNPFEPLPPAFGGDYIELQFTYYYNLQPEYTR